jgi:tRNA (mo5U34)-methyltransferase
MTTESRDPESGNGSEEIRRQVTALAPWFHNLHLPDGTQTAPEHFLGDFPAYKWGQLAAHIPSELDGWSVLDIGCNAGFYSFELARRGARVTAIDSNPHYLRQAQWAARLYGLEKQIEFHCMQVYELARQRPRYDLVLFMGVLYHLRYPLLGLDVVARTARRLLCVQSLTLGGAETFEAVPDMSFDERDRLLQPGWPRAAFVEHRFAADPTVWWVPNHSCMQAMLRSCRLRVLSRPAPETYLCEPEGEAPADRFDPARDEYLAVTGLQSGASTTISGRR